MQFVFYRCVLILYFVELYKKAIGNSPSYKFDLKKFTYENLKIHCLKAYLRCFLLEGVNISKRGLYSKFKNLDCRL